MAALRFCAFDVETRGRDARFLSGALYWDDDGRYYTDADAMLADMRALAKQGYTFAAHHAEYDATVLFWQRGEDFTIHYLNNLYSVGYWRFGKGRRMAQVWDTYKLAAGLPLKALGEAIGLPKYETPKRLLDPEDPRQDWVCEAHGTAGCIICYNLRDAEIVYRFLALLQDWVNGHELEIKRSLPSMAVALWQVWDKDRQQTLHSATVRKLARAAYHGGRVEVFRYGAVYDVRVYDHRSHYGAIMAHAELPDTTRLTYSPGLPRTFDLDGVEGVIEAEVSVPPLPIPPLPVIHDKRVYYPVGRFRGAWPIVELREAVKRGAVVHSFGAGAWTTYSCRPFQVTAAALLDVREDYRRQGSPLALIPKMMLNAIPGRLGLREVQTRRIYRRWRPGLKPEEIAGMELESAGDAMYLCREFDVTRAPAHSNPLWAAQITALGRIKLLEMLEAAGAGVVYCDTDSVHTLGTLPTGPDMPGQIVLEGEYQIGRYLAPKLYRLESYTGQVEIRAKGIPRAAAAQYFATGQAVYQTSLGVVEAMSRGMAPGTWVDVERVKGLQPAARAIVNPLALTDADQASATLPVVFGANLDGTVSPQE